jgi:hypothetical protein
LNVNLRALNKTLVLTATANAGKDQPRADKCRQPEEDAVDEEAEDEANQHE